MKEEPSLQGRENDDNMTGKREGGAQLTRSLLPIWIRSMNLGRRPNISISQNLTPLRQNILKTFKTFHEAVTPKKHVQVHHYTVHQTEPFRIKELKDYPKQSDARIQISNASSTPQFLSARRRTSLDLDVVGPPYASRKSRLQPLVRPQNIMISDGASRTFFEPPSTKISTTPIFEPNQSLS
jgi:hypothetical protein